MRYLSGFVEGKDAKVVITKDGPTLITDGRYLVEAAQQRLPYRIVLNRAETNQLLAEFFRGRVGIEAEHLSVATLEGFRQDFPNLEFVPTKGIFERLRRQKSPRKSSRSGGRRGWPIRALPTFCPTSSQGYGKLRWPSSWSSSCGKMVPKAWPSAPLWLRGAQRHAPRGASMRTIQAGELVTLDFGCVVGGYCSDMTRTVAVGQVSKELRSIYQAVLEAQTLALEAVAPGKTGRELDTLARDHLKQLGYAEHFTHSLGHGVGLFIHEAPSLSQASEDVLEVNQVVTIEPGVYIPSLGGCRIEDLVLVTEQGHEVLSRSPKHLMEL